MRRFLLTVLLLCASIAFAHTASAKIIEFTDFTIDMPEGWTHTREGITVAFLANDKSATLLVTVETTENETAEELALAYAEELHGSRPVQEDPNYYSFTFKSPDGIDSEASIIVYGKRFYLITISGKNNDLAPMVASVISSIY